MVKPSPPAGKGWTGDATVVTTACSGVLPVLAMVSGLSTSSLPSTWSE